MTTKNRVWRRNIRAIAPSTITSVATLCRPAGDENLGIAGWNSTLRLVNSLTNSAHEYRAMERIAVYFGQFATENNMRTVSVGPISALMLHPNVVKHSGIERTLRIENGSINEKPRRSGV